MRDPINVFGVSDDVHQSINAWLRAQQALPPEQRVKPGVYPDQYCVSWRVAGQAAFARVWCETPYLLLAGGIAAVLLPVLLLLSLVKGFNS